MTQRTSQYAWRQGWLPEGPIQRTKKWANRNLMKFNSDKYQVLHRGKKKPLQWHRPGSSSEEKDLRVLVDGKLGISQQCVLAAKKVSCAMLAEAQLVDWGKWFSPSPQHLWDCICSPASSFGPPNRKKRINNLEWVQQRPTKLAGGWSTCPVRRGWPNSSPPNSRPKGSYQEDEMRLFTSWEDD